MWIVLLALCFLFEEAVCGAGIGSCPQLSDSRQINSDKLIGKWYVIAAMDDIVSFHKCGSIEFVTTDNPYSLNMTMRYLHRMSATMSAESTKELVPRKPGQRIYDYRMQFSMWRYDAEYWITNTDYDSWALLYVCERSTVMFKISGYFMSRERDERCLTNEQKMVIKERIERIPGWETNLFEWQDQSNCIDN